MRTITQATCALAVSLCANAATYAQETEQKTQLHGFGSWHYGRTTEPNLFLGGTPKGEFDNTRLGLSLSSHLSEKGSIAVQLDVATGHDTEVEIDFAFGSWRFSDAAILKVGSVKLPFGISTEVFDVGTLRPFLDLAPAFYGRSGIIAENYKGLGLSGGSGTAWRVSYDVFVGGLELVEFEAPEDVANGEEFDPTESAEEHFLRDAVGGRLSVETPVAGLTFGASAYSGQHEELDQRQRAWGAHGEYLAGPWSVRSEFAESRAGEEARKAFYLEGARRLGRWQIAGRYDWLDTSIDDLPRERASTSLLRHKSFSLGLNYWLTPELVLKAAITRVDGNRLAAPALEHLAQAFERNELRSRTDLFQFGVQFSF
jgi:hypothetical protein